MSFPHTGSLPESITVGYWSIRGLAAPLRMMVMFAGVRLQAENFDCIENSTKDGFDVSSWFSVKEVYKAKNPLINLPFVEDGDVLVTQSNACFSHLGRRLNMMGKDWNEYSQCEQLLCEIMDVRNTVIGLCYGSRPSDNMTKWFQNITAKSGSIDKLDLWLSRKYEGVDSETVFFVGESATAPDFHIWEILDQLKLMAAHFGCEDPFKNHAMLAKFHASFVALPQNQKYFESALAKLPVNNMMAKFGATPSGAPWTFGSENTWTNSKGVY